MQAQAFYTATVRINPAELALTHGLSPQGSSHLMAISTLQDKAPGETLVLRRRRG